MGIAQKKNRVLVKLEKGEARWFSMVNDKYTNTFHMKKNLSRPDRMTLLTAVRFVIVF